MPQIYISTLWISTIHDLFLCSQSYRTFLDARPGLKEVGELLEELVSFCRFPKKKRITNLVFGRFLTKEEVDSKTASKLVEKIGKSLSEDVSVFATSHCEVSASRMNTENLRYFLLPSKLGQFLLFHWWMEEKVKKLDNNKMLIKQLQTCSSKTVLLRRPSGSGRFGFGNRQTAICSRSWSTLLFGKISSPTSLSPFEKLHTSETFLKHCFGRAQEWYKLKINSSPVCFIIGDAECPKTRFNFRTHRH